MNKRTITIDQLIREEYLKIQKQNYLKNLVNEVTSEIQEQQTKLKTKPLAGGTITKYLVPILQSAGYDIEYQGKQTFQPIDSNDPLFDTPIVKKKFSKQFPGLHFKNVLISGGNIQNLMIGVKALGSGQTATYDQEGNIRSILIKSKNVSFDISNLPKSLNSIAGKIPPFSEQELKNQFILDPNGYSAVIEIKRISSKSRSDDFRNLSFNMSPDGTGTLDVSSKTTSKSSIGVSGIATFGKQIRSNGFQIEINIIGQLIPIQPVEMDAVDSVEDSLSIEKDFPALKSVSDKNFVPMTGSGETTTPDAVLKQLTPSQREEVRQLQKELDSNDLYVEVLSKYIAQKYDWILTHFPDWMIKTAEFIVWFFAWVLINNPVSQLILDPSLDNFQNLLNWVGFVDIYFIGTIADGVNAVISLCRYAATDDKRYLVDAAISAFAMIPFYGLAGNYSNILKPVTRNAKVLKVLKRSKDLVTAAAKLSKSKLWKRYIEALVKGDVSTMANVIRKMEKKGLLTREQLAYMAGPDGVKVLSIYLASGKKNILEFEKYLVKLNKKLPPKSQIDIEWAIKHMDGASIYANSMSQSFQLAYNNALKPNLIQRGTNLVIKAGAKGTNKLVKGTMSVIKSGARFVGIYALLGSITPAFAITAVRLFVKNSKIYQKLFAKRKLLDMGKDSSEFLRKMWYQDLWGNPGKLALAFNKTFQVNIKNVDDLLKRSGRVTLGTTDKTALSFLSVFNSVTQKQIRNVTDISKAELSAFLVTLKNGAFKSKGVTKKAQKQLYKEIASAVSAGSANKTSKLWIDFQSNGLKNILNGKLSKYWTREAVQQQGWTVMINGIFSIKFADIAFDEMNAVMEKEGLGWGQDPSEADQQKNLDQMKGCLLKFIYDACLEHDVPYEQNLREFKNVIVDKVAPYWETIQINSEVAIDAIQGGISNLTDEQTNKIKGDLESYPGLVGDLDSETGRLIAPKYIKIGNRRVFNPWIRPTYRGSKDINQELFADSGIKQVIGDDWHTGDGKTGREIKYWKAGDLGIPSNILASILLYQKNTPEEEINIPLSFPNQVSIAKQISRLELAAKSKYAKGPNQYIWLPGPPNAEQVISYVEQVSSAETDTNSSLTKELLRSILPDQYKKLIDKPKIEKEQTNEQDFPGPFGKEHDYSDYGGPWGTGHHHKTKFKKGPGKNPTDSISSDRGEEETEDDRITGYKLVSEDPKKGTGKKPKGSGRRLYTDENPKDTVSVKFKTKQDVSDTLNKSSFKSKSHKRQSQIINLIHQRLRVAVERTKDPEKKKRLKSAYDYIKNKKEVSKEKTKRLNKENFADGKNPGRKGLSQRVGIPKNATIAQLEKAAKADGEKGRLARWQLNMRRGKKKKK